MYRAPFKTYRTRRIAVFGFLVLGLLTLIAVSNPWATAQAGWRVEVKEGETARSSLAINNRCAKPHSFRIQSSFKGLSFNESTDSLAIEANGTKSIGALFDATNLKSKVYRGQVAVDCLDCKKEHGCSQDRDELNVEMNVVRPMNPAGAKADANANATTAGNLTLNKFVYPGNTNITLPTSTNPNLIASNPPITSSGIGVPILYVITLEDSAVSTAAVAVTLKDDLGSNNANFHVLNISCAGLNGASCGTYPSTAPMPLTFSPTVTGGGSEIVIQVLGYYDAAGTFSNTVTVPDPSNPTVPLATNTKLVSIQADWSMIDLGISKTSKTTDTSVPGTIRYTVKLTGDPSQDFYPGNLLYIQDTLRAGAVPLPGYTVSSSSLTYCTSLSGSTCPATPSPANPGPYISGSNSYANFSLAWPAGAVIKKGDTLTLVFDVKVTAALCNTSTKVENQASISMNGFNYVDKNNLNNLSTPWTSDTFTTGTQACTVTPPIASITKQRVCPSTGCKNVNWGGTVTYQITVTNNTNTSQNLVVADNVAKGSITPPLKASLSPTGSASDVHCSTGVTCTTTSSSPQSVLLDAYGYTLFQTSFTLAAKGTVTLTFDVKIDKLSDCQMELGNTFLNSANVSVVNGNPPVATYVAGTPNVSATIEDLPLCAMLVTKKLDSPAKVTFGQPVSYTVTYENQNPTQPITVRSLRDHLNIMDASNPNNYAYGSIPITGLAVACTATGAVSPMPFLNQTATQIYQSNLDWAGLALIQESSTATGITFPPNSKLSCTVSFTPHAPSATDNLCQGTGTPEIVNSAFMDVSGLQYYGAKPSSTYFKQAIAPLPLCRKVAVVKTPVDANGNAVSSTGPGGLLTFQIKIVNLGSDPVDNFVLADPLPAGFMPVGAVSCTPSTACTSVPTITGSSSNQVLNAVFNQIPGTKLSPTNTVTLSFQVTAPTAGGTYKNTATGSFTSNTNSSGTDFYFEGDPNVLVNSADVQVLTPVLAKVFSPPNIAANGTSTATFTITNMNSDPAQTGISFTDLLPSGVTVTSSPSTACGGSVSVSGGNAVTLSNASLTQGQHSCQFSVVVKASSCGDLINDRSNFSKVTNLDVTNVHGTLTVTGCNDGGLTIHKEVPGAPAGFTGQFSFLVQCATPKGFYQKPVTVNWPTPGFVTLNDVPAGSQCIVTEGPPPSSLPNGYNWAGLPQYQPAGGLVSVGPKGGQVTVSNTLSPCNEKGQVTITKIVEGLSKDYVGVFEGTLQCWIGDKLQTFPVSLTSPNGLSTTIGNIPLGSTCTFQETGQPALRGDLKWDPPVYSPAFGTVTLSGECCQQVTVTNHARHCCTGVDNPGYNNQPAGPTVIRVDPPKPSKRKLAHRRKAVG